MTILHYIPSIDENSGGVGAYMQLLTRDLGKLCDLHVVTHRSAKMRVLENCTLHFIPQNNNPFSGKSKAEFLTLLDKVCPDIFHANCCWLPFSARCAMWAKQAGRKVVYTPHGMLEPWIMKRHFWTRKWPALLLYQRKAIEMADVIHATADSEKNNLIRDSRFSIPASRITVIPNGINVEAIETKKSWERKRNILFLSRVHPKKGINFLIEAAALMKDELQGYKIVVAGESFGSYVEELKKMAVANGVSGMFNFMGGVYGDDKWRLYKEADLFVLPTHSENFGIVVAEALASGTPVITTKGTPWCDLKDYNCGWWTEIGVQPTVVALRQFLALTEAELEAMGNNGRKLVEGKYSAKAVAGQFVEMYNKML